MTEELDRVLGIESAESNTEQAGDPATAEKLGGWLILPALGVSLGPIIGGIQVVMGFSAISNIPRLDQGAFAFGLCIDAALVLFTLFAAVLFFGRKRNAPTIMISLFIASVVAHGIGYGMIASMGREPWDALLGLVRSAIGAAIWIPYFRVSKRVKRTFVL